MNSDVKVVELDIDDVLPNRFQPRIKFNEDSIDELADSIKDHGVIQPIVVRRLGSKYEIIAGERRYKACVKIGKPTIPAIITDLNDKDSAEVALIENVQRKNLTPIEEAVSYRKILDMGYLTQESLANKLGKKQSTIANKLRLLNLTDEVQEALLQDKISERHARSLLRISNKQDQIAMLDRIIAERMPVRKLDEEIIKFLNKTSDKDTDTTRPKPNTTTLDDIINNVQTKMKKENKKENFMNNNMFGRMNIPSEPIIDNTGSNNMDYNNINSMQPVNNINQMMNENNIDSNTQTRFDRNFNEFEEHPEPVNNNLNTNIDNNQPTESRNTRSNRFFNMFTPINSDENFVDDLETKSVDMDVLLNKDRRASSFDEMDIPRNPFERTNQQDIISPDENTQQPAGNSRYDRLYPSNDDLNQVHHINNEFNNTSIETQNTTSDVMQDFEILDFNDEPVSFDNINQQPMNQVYNNYAYRDVEEIPINRPEPKSDRLYMVKDLKTAINTVRNSIETVEKYGFKVDTDEIDFEDKYQIIINIEKR